MQPRTAQTPEHILRPHDRLAAVRRDPAQERGTIPALGNGAYFRLRPIKVQRVSAHNDEHGSCTQKPAYKQAIHALSIHGGEQ